MSRPLEATKKCGLDDLREMKNGRFACSGCGRVMDENFLEVMRMSLPYASFWKWADKAQGK